MFAKIIAFFRRLKEQRRLAREIEPRAFLELSSELRDLADTASKLWQLEPEFQARVRRIMSETQQLEALANRPEFRRLSAQKRLEIKKGLIHSRQQLLDSMQQAPPPTTTIQ